jgi:threonine/homoserine efflux transporter RhtA
VLIISLVLAVIGLAALVFAVITSNELVAWVCIGASVLGVLLLIIDDEAADYPADAIDETDGATGDSLSDEHKTS